MFKPIVTKYLSETKYKHWSIISILKYTKSKCRLYSDSINNLKSDIYASLQCYKENDNHVYVNNKLDKIITDFEKSFSTTEVKEFVDELREEQEERGFDTACKINATSASAVKALECHRMNHTRINELNNDEHEEGGSSRRCTLRKRSRINYAEKLYSSEEETEPTYKVQQKKVKGQSSQSGIIQENRSMPVRDEENDGPKTPLLRPRQITITTPHKPTLSELSIQYLAKHVSVNVNGQCVIMKTDQVDTIPEEIRSWLVTALTSEKDVFKSVIMTPLSPDHQFRKVCETILYDFFSMTSESTLDRNIGERKYIVDRIGPLFKAIQSFYKEYMFDWIEVQADCIKDVMLLFPEFDLTLNKVDGIGVKVASNKEIVFIEVSGGPENAVIKHIKEDTEKLIKEAMFGLVSLLRDYLDKSAENVKNLRTFMVQCIGDRVTLSELRLDRKQFYTVSQIKSASIPFSFDEIAKFLEVFELLYALISGLINQTRELKKLMLSKPVDNNLSVRDWIWVPNSTETWEAIEIIYEDMNYDSFDL